VQFEAHAAEIKERISGLKRQSTTCQLVLPQEVNRDQLFTDEEILAIHNAIHVCFNYFIGVLCCCNISLFVFVFVCLFMF
jgi:hypothetical protein